ncbi:MAG: A/G-specific adenine glycosylase [Selenomonadales bacterium]|nr:A/G-specific adenine glycosylase [Selenomonadales bacterium]
MSMQAEIHDDIRAVRLLSHITMPLLAWYEKEARDLPWRTMRDPYAVWVSEIMLQQTRVEAVKPYFARFMKVYPTVGDLAEADETQLLKLWEGLGYYSRARNLKKAAQTVMAEYGGRLPRSYDALLTLSGIGTYTAGAIASIAFGIPVPAVDGNVLRVVSRIVKFDDDIADARTKRAVTRWLTEAMPKERAGDFNQAIMDLGAMVCLPVGKARCEICPLNMICEAYLDDVVEAFPVKSEKKNRRIEKRTVWLLTCGDKIAIRRRPSAGLLAGMWEFPNEEGTRAMKAWRDELALRGWQVSGLKRAGKANHIFTHIEWKMEGYWAELTEPISEWEWVGRDELTDVYPIPTAFRYFQQQVLAKEVQK